MCVPNCLEITSIIQGRTSENVNKHINSTGNTMVLRHQVCVAMETTSGRVKMVNEDKIHSYLDNNNECTIHLAS